MVLFDYKNPYTHSQTIINIFDYWLLVFSTAPPKVYVWCCIKFFCFCENERVLELFLPCFITDWMLQSCAVPGQIQWHSHVHLRDACLQTTLCLHSEMFTSFILNFFYCKEIVIRNVLYSSIRLSVVLINLHALLRMWHALLLCVLRRERRNVLMTLQRATLVS